MYSRLATRVLAATFAAGLVGAANAQQRLPDRREARPSPAVASATNQAMLDLLREVEALQALVRQLRGQLEVQEHQIEQMKSRQSQAQIDFDRRLRELERRAAALSAASANAGAPPVVVTPPVNGGAVSSAAAVAPPSSPPRAPTASEQQQYDAAFALMKQGLYDQASKSFREFLARNPRGALADNAQYWLGEAAYVMRDFRTALDEFSKVLENYPQSPKVPDALLKIGYTHYELAAYERARETLSQVMARYPNTVVAKSAELRLEKMASERR